MTADELETIYRRSFARAMGLAVTLLHNDEDARDVVHDVFARLWASPMAIDNPDAFVFRSVRNACINHLEKMETRERIRRLLPLEGMELQEQAETGETHERLAAVRMAAAALLTNRESEVVREVFTDGRSYKEAAQRLDLSVSAVNKHVVSALRKLRNHFKSSKS